MKKLKLDYRKVKDKHNNTGENRSTWKFFDAMDAILGPTTRPAVLVDTSENPEAKEEDQAEDGDNVASSLDQWPIISSGRGRSFAYIASQLVFIITVFT